VPKGRPREPYIKDSAGREIPGLRGTPASDPRRFYFIDESGQKVWLSTNKAAAIAQFRARSERLPEGFSKHESGHVSINLNEADWEEVIDHVIREEKRRVAPKIKQWLTDDPEEAADLIGIPQLADIWKKVPRPESLSLAEVGTMYLDRTDKALNSRWRRDCKRYWEEFCRLTACAALADLSADAVGRYREAIYTARRTKQCRPRYVNNRFDAVGTVMSHARTEGRDADNLARATNLLRMLRRLPSDE
jgi:hypothetical protein